MPPFPIFLKPPPNGSQLRNKSAGSRPLPRRGTTHDMGRCVSHKTPICRKRKVERKPTSLVAQETHHSPEAVDRYTLNLDRVSFCLGRNLSPEDTSCVTGLRGDISALLTQQKNFYQKIFYLDKKKPCSHNRCDLFIRLPNSKTIQKKD